MDGDIFENAPRVDADIFYTDEKRCVFINIRIRVDGTLDCGWFPEFLIHVCDALFEVKVTKINSYINIDGKSGCKIYGTYNLRLKS